MDNLIKEIVDIEVPQEISKEARFILINIVTNKIVMEIFLEEEMKNLQINLGNLNNHLNYMYKFQIKDEGKWQDFTDSFTLFPEQYNCENELRYSFIEYPGSDKLLIVFSSSAHSNRYNYIKTVRDCKINKLFISDENTGFDDTTCSYYIGTNKEKLYEKKLIKFIETLRKQRSFKKENVFLFGSSKGGFAALYYTFKYGFGNAIVGSPTIYLGKMHKDNERGRKIISTITGEANSININWLNNLITEEMIRSNHSPTLYYHVGKKETRYTRHAVHFLKELDKNGKAVYHLDLDDYSNHSEVINYFPPYAMKILNQISE